MSYLYEFLRNYMTLIKTGTEYLQLLIIHVTYNCRKVQFQGTCSKHQSNFRNVKLTNKSNVQNWSKQKCVLGKIGKYSEAEKVCVIYIKFRIHGKKSTKTLDKLFHTSSYKKKSQTKRINHKKKKNYN